jgi:hypothetical protein
MVSRCYSIRKTNTATFQACKKLQHSSKTPDEKIAFYSTVDFPVEETISTRIAKDERSCRSRSEPEGPRADIAKSSAFGDDSQVSGGPPVRFLLRETSPAQRKALEGISQNALID